MPGGTTQNNIVVRTELGPYTGDMRYKTNDGKWWKTWRGKDIGTGDEIRELRFE